MQDKPEKAFVLVKSFSVHEAQARYQDALVILLGLNRDHTDWPSMLTSLVPVFGRLWDVGKAAFLRAFLRERPDDEWGRTKLEQYAALGVA